MTQPFSSWAAGEPEGGADDIAPVVPWEMFEEQFAWRQDQHVGMIGPTDSGKSTLMFNILNRRKYVALFATKPSDRVLAEFGGRAVISGCRVALLAQVPEPAEEDGHPGGRTEADLVAGRAAPRRDREPAARVP